MVTALRDASVLVVDDDPAMLELLSAALEPHVAKVLVAGSVREAMTLFEHAQPTLILSDICMPGEDGYDLIRRVRSTSSGRRTPAIALSSYTEHASQHAALAAGFDMFMRKPIDAHHFLALLRELLAA